MVTATPINKKNRGIFLKRSVIFISRSAIIAALYLALSMAVPGIAFGPIQFRISEALCLLPIFMPESIPGLILGCLFTNLFSGFGLYDVLIGTLATALSVVFTRLLKKHIVLASLPPMIFNALLIPAIFILAGAEPTTYALSMAQIFASQLIICGIIGIPLTLTLKKALVRAHLLDLTDKRFNALPYYRETDENDKNLD